ncbi:hypothetical protein SAMN06272737_12632 [Blastococcus mobilis]|uniref:Uncharacterized protein n=1 Tax=Blastococcus mobilis TaxID=1938746 RepID=A0A238Z936_9ACTN|nr:hypothetical protein SAMN06272737_12632 [Blastococcus mobilis]
MAVVVHSRGWRQDLTVCPEPEATTAIPRRPALRRRGLSPRGLGLLLGCQPSRLMSSRRYTTRRPRRKPSGPTPKCRHSAGWPPECAERRRLRQSQQLGRRRSNIVVSHGRAPPRLENSIDGRPPSTPHRNARPSGIRSVPISRLPGPASVVLRPLPGPTPRHGLLTGLSRPRFCSRSPVGRRQPRDQRPHGLENHWRSAADLPGTRHLLPDLAPGEPETEPARSRRCGRHSGAEPPHGAVLTEQPSRTPNDSLARASVRGPSGTPSASACGSWCRWFLRRASADLARLGSWRSTPHPEHGETAGPVIGPPGASARGRVIEVP